jgi:hypothetical protein
MTNSWAEPPSRPALEMALPTLLKQLKLAQFRSQWQAAEQQARAEGWDPGSYLYVLAEQEHQLSRVNPLGRFATTKLAGEGPQDVAGDILGAATRKVIHPASRSQVRTGFS